MEDTSAKATGTTLFEPGGCACISNIDRMCIWSPAKNIDVAKAHDKRRRLMGWGHKGQGRKSSFDARWGEGATMASVAEVTIVSGHYTDILKKRREMKSES